MDSSGPCVLNVTSFVSRCCTLSVTPHHRLILRQNSSQVIQLVLLDRTQVPATPTNNSGSAVSISPSVSLASIQFSSTRLRKMSILSQGSQANLNPHRRTTWPTSRGPPLIVRFISSNDPGVDLPRESRRILESVNSSGCLCYPPSPRRSWIGWARCCGGAGGAAGLVGAAWPSETVLRARLRGVDKLRSPHGSGVSRLSSFDPRTHTHVHIRVYAYLRADHYTSKKLYNYPKNLRKLSRNAERA